MSSKQWDNYGDRREEKRGPPRDLRSESSQKYSRDGHDYRRKEHRKDPSCRDRKRSPPRRRASSPGREALDKKRFAEEEKYRFRRDSVGGRQSVDPYREAELRYRRTSPDPRLSYRHHECKGKQQSSDPEHRRHLQGHRGGEGSRDHTESHTVKKPVKHPERSNSPSEDMLREDRKSDYPKYEQNGSDRQSFPSGVPSKHAPTPQETSSKGFERFLDVLNKGVNVNLLAQIMNQSPTEVEADLPLPLVISATRPHWSPGQAEPTAQELHRPDSPRLAPQSFGHSEEEPPPMSEPGPTSNFPPVQETPLLTPEEEHKRRQMQDVLQAIGVDLGLEELGQMSHRIQERLYGRRDGNRRSRKPSREGSACRERSPRQRSQSSTPSRSTVTPLPRDGYERRRSHSNQGEEAGQDRPSTVDPDPDPEVPPLKSEVRTSSSSSHSEVSKSSPVPSNFPPFPPSFPWSPPLNPPWSSAPDTPWLAPQMSAPPPFPQWSPAAVSKPLPPPPPPPPPSSVTPPYSPIPFPPPSLPNASHQFFPPPHLPHPPFPQIQHSNTFPTATPHVHSVQTKPKPQPRHRCLQVIEIKTNENCDSV